MKLYTITLLLGLLLVSCNNKRDIKKIRQTFNQTTYDSNIIKNVPLYDSLKNIIIKNIDTIFKFRNSRHFVFHLYANGDTATIQEDANFYQFYYNYGDATALSYGTGQNDQKLIDAVSVENMPAFIYPSVDRIFRKLGKDKIRGFTLWTDSTIEIAAKGFIGQDDIEVSHSLIYKRFFGKNNDPELFVKDTIISKDWQYQIYVDQRLGW